MGFGDDVELGVGDGFGVLDGDALAVGLGLEVAFFVDVLGEGVGLADEPDDALGVVLGEADVLVGVAELALAADLPGVALALADAGRLCAGTV